MDKMIGMGTRMQKAIASGDYDNIYDDTGAERAPTMPASPSAAMPIESGPSIITNPTSGQSLPAFTSATRPGLATNLNSLLTGGIVPVSEKKTNKNHFVG